MINDQLPRQSASPVVAIGNFDGVHEGHGEILKAAQTQAYRQDTQLLVLTFEPHPRTVLFPKKPVHRLTSARIKEMILTARGAKQMGVLPFTQALSRVSPEAFIVDILCDRLQSRHVIVGENFRFGHRAQGTAKFLQEMGKRHSFGVSIISDVLDAEGKMLSSSHIRGALSRGDMRSAHKMLGYRWFIRGVVVHGAKRGGSLGYPTANLRLREPIPLACGIYATRVRIGSKIHNGVASYGHRPMFDNGSACFEVHIFNFNGDLYAQEIDVQCIAYLRPEQTFQTPAALTAEIARDCDRAERILAKEAPISALDERVF